MKLKDLKIQYFKGRPPKVKEGSSLLPYLNPDYIRTGAIPEFYPLQSGVVLVEDNDLILLWDGSNAGEFFRGKKGILGSTMVKFNKLDGVKEDYFYYSLKFQEPTLKSKTSGSGIPHVDKEMLLNLNIYLPNKEDEQSIISTILTTIDQAIEKTEQLIAKYERIKTGLMQDLLTRGIDEQGNIRSEETHEFKDSGLGRIPREWEIKTMVDLCLVNPQKNKVPNNFFVSFLAMADVSDNAKIIGGSEVPFEKVSSGFTSFIEGDILVAKITPCFENGKGAFAAGLKNGVGYGSTEFHVLRPKEGVSGRLIYHLTTSTKFRNAGRAVMIGSAGQQRVQRQFFERYFFPFPKEKKEQERICEILDSQDGLIEKEQSKLGKYQGIKTALMQDLLTGKVRVDTLIKTTQTI